MRRSENRFHSGTRASLCRTILLPVLVATGVLGALPAAAQDQGQFGKVIRIERNAFKPNAGLITFDEVRRDTRNPVYKPADYGADANGVTVTFGGFFRGQRLADHAQCPEGASRTGCVAGTPVSPLTIDAAAPYTYTTDDGANPDSPSLSGNPRWNGPISMVFSRDVAGVGLFGGYFDARRTTAIQAYDRSGRLIGGVKNVGLGMEYMALVTEDGRERIAGLQFSLVGPEPAGFGIDGLSFAFASQLDRKQIPGLGDLLIDEGVDEDAGKRNEKPAGGSLSDLLKGADADSDGKETPGGGGGGGGGSLQELLEGN